MREGEQPGARGDLGEDQRERLLRWVIPDARDADPRARGLEWAEQPGMLDVGCEDVVVGVEGEAAEDDVAAVRGRPGQRKLLRRRVQQRGEPRTKALPGLHQPLPVAGSAAALLEVTPAAELEGRRGRAAERPKGAGIEVGEPLEHRELSASGSELHSFTILRP